MARPAMMTPTGSNSFQEWSQMRRRRKRFSLPVQCSLVVGLLLCCSLIPSVFGSGEGVSFEQVTLWVASQQTFFNSSFEEAGIKEYRDENSNTLVQWRRLENGMMIIGSRQYDFLVPSLKAVTRLNCSDTFSGSKSELKDVRVDWWEDGKQLQYTRLSTHRLNITTVTGVNSDTLEINSFFDEKSIQKRNYTCKIVMNGTEVHKQTFIYKSFTINQETSVLLDTLVKKKREFPMAAYLNATNITNSSVLIRWTYAEVPDYGNKGNVTEVKLTLKPKERGRSKSWNLAGSVNQLPISGLEAGKKYEVKAITKNSVSYQESDPVTFEVYHKPVIDCGAENRTVWDEDDVNVTCTITGIPHPSLSFEVKNNNKNKYTVFTHVHTNRVQKMVGTIRFLKVQYEPGLKVCGTAANVLEEVTKCVPVFVQLLCPKFDVQNSTVRMTAKSRRPGGKATVLCNKGYRRFGAKHLFCTKHKQTNKMDWSKELPQCRLITPSRVELSQNVLVVPQGHLFSVMCQVTGVPTPKVRWFLNGEGISDLPVLVTSVNNGTHTLRGNQSVIGDFANVTCSATNDEGNSSSTMSIVLFSKEEARVEEGDSYSFLCPASLSGLQLHWIGPSGEVSPNENFTSSSAALEHSGNYNCRTMRNETLSMLSLQVVGTLNIEDPLNDTNIRPYYGRKTTLSCKYRTKTPVTVQWLNNGKLVQGSMNSATDGDINMATLTIDRVTYVHDGRITCEISNGLTVKKATFILKGKPKGSCHVYHGEQCKEFLGGKRVFYIEEIDSGPMPWNETEIALQRLFNGTVKGFQENQECMFFAKQILCEYVFPPCDPSAPPQSEWKRRICAEDCRIISTQICANEWQEMVSYKNRGSINFGPVQPPDCSGLPSHHGGDSPECMRSLRLHSADLEKEDKTEDCYCDDGQGYHGNVSVTADNEMCAKWNSSYPHVHPSFIEKKKVVPWAELAGNFCRNPQGRAEKPWCYTSEKRRWNHCNVPRCKHDINEMCQQFSITNNNPVCAKVPLIANSLIKERWQRKDIIALENYITARLDNSKTKGMSERCIEHHRTLMCLHIYSVCTRPHEGSCGTSESPVCLSYCEAVQQDCPLPTDRVTSHLVPDFVRRKMENVSFCHGYSNNSRGVFSECIQFDLHSDLIKLRSENRTSSLSVSQPLVSNQNPSARETGIRCYHDDDRGKSYNGSAHTTVTGQFCQPWASSRPHLPAPHYRGNIYFDSLVFSLCRNPGGTAKKPWCYTSDPSQRWDYCDVPMCSAPSSRPFPTTAVIIGVTIPSVVILFVLLLLYLGYTSLKKKQYLRDIKVMRFAPSCTEDPTSPVALKSWSGPRGSTGGQLTVSRENREYWMTSPDLIGIAKISHKELHFLALIAEGNFGKVWRGMAENLEGQAQTTVAIKTLKADANDQGERNFIKEAKAMSRFKHVNIIRLLAVGIPDADLERPFCLLFEYMEHGDLQHFLREAQRHRRPTVDIVGRKLSMESSELHFRDQRGSSQSSSSSGSLYCLNQVDLCRIAAQIAYGMQYLSHRRYVHRDLAARNCLVGKGLVVKIADFGLSRDIHLRDYYKPEANWAQLPVRWMPPEVIMYGKHTTESDVWSFGVVLWEIFTLGAVPYYELSNEEVVQRVCHDHKRLAQPPDCPSLIYGLMQECWFEEAEERPYFRRLWKVLNKWRPPQGTGTSDYASGNDSDPELSNPSSDEVFEEPDEATVISPHGTRVPTDPRTSSVTAVPSPVTKRPRSLAARASDSGHLADDSDSHSSSPKHHTKQRLPELSRNNQSDA